MSHVVGLRLNICGWSVVCHYTSVHYATLTVPYVSQRSSIFRPFRAAYLVK